MKTDENQQRKYTEKRKGIKPRGNSKTGPYLSAESSQNRSIGLAY